MSVKDRTGTRATRSFLILLCMLLPLQLLGSTGARATQSTLLSRSLDPSCIRFDDPNAVANGEIVYAEFTAYQSGLDHAVETWSPARGFTVSFREAIPVGDAVPEEANLIYRDVGIPGSAFKGVTVTWSHAPATITLNRATMPSPETDDPLEQELIQAVMTHETGHALGLGDVPTPGVNIRECANMLMKRSVDKGGGRFTEPQPADIALYCMRWGGTICGDDLRPIATPEPGHGLELEPHVVASPAPLVRSQTTTSYRYLVVTCEWIPREVITPDQVESDSLLAEAESGCVRAPAGILFHVHLSDGATELALTGRDGEFVLQKPDGIGIEVDMPQGAYGRFPSLLGYQPLEVFDRIPAHDPDC